MSSKRFTTAVFIVALLFAVTLRSEDAPCEICGTWTLIDRIDTAPDGRVIAEPNRGSNPLGILSYDAAGNVSVQLMKRDRTGSSAGRSAPQPQTINNSAAVGGYDAYFGKYRLNRQAGTVTHTIQGALQAGMSGNLSPEHTH